MLSDNGVIVWTSDIVDHSFYIMLKCVNNSIWLIPSHTYWRLLLSSLGSRDLI